MGVAPLVSSTQPIVAHKLNAIDYMTYTRGSSEDYDRYASVSGDSGWGWNEIQPYFRKVNMTSVERGERQLSLSYLQNERFVTPADHHNTTGEFDPNVHSFRGINSVTLPGYPRAIDSHILQATKELPDSFPFNLDYNSGYQLGIGEY